MGTTHDPGMARVPCDIEQDVHMGTTHDPGVACVPCDIEQDVHIAVEFEEAYETQARAHFRSQHIEVGRRPFLL